MSLLREVKIIFFDVGNVFVSDDPSALFIFRRLYDSMGGSGTISKEEFFARRVEYAKQKRGLWAFVRDHLPEGTFEAFQKGTRADLYDQWGIYSPEIPETPSAARQLATKWRMGIIANQPAQIEGVLRDRNLWNSFGLHIISQIVGCEKPGQRIFELALEQAGVAPEQALMVGDRIDNDIIPAKRVGMKTLWLSLGYKDRGWRPADEFESAYVDSLARHDLSLVPPENPECEPDFMATSARDLLKILG
ncbi:MAG: HAD-IA family hydrolase [Candidatus Sumerlaeaceae bacterium]|nr:HAD-IA family hydrolase [Candidatus Sumerlaeaceae bacterium]